MAKPSNISISVYGYTYSSEEILMASVCNDVSPEIIDEITEKINWIPTASIGKINISAALYNSIEIDPNHEEYNILLEAIEHLSTILYNNNSPRTKINNITLDVFVSIANNVLIDTLLMFS